MTVPADERRALLELIDRIGAAWQPRGPGVEERVAAARATLVESGVWALGLPEAHGGGGADRVITQLAVSRVSAFWPAVGLSMAHLHAAGVGLAGCDRLAVAAAGGPVAIVPVAEPPERGAQVTRVDVGAHRCDLVLVHGPGCWYVPADRATFGEPSRRTGLDGALPRPVEVPAGAAAALPADADAVRVALYGGVLAVAAGLVHAASDHASGYAAERVQFGAPLTALPTMRERLSTLCGRATALLGVALLEPVSVYAAAASTRDALDLAVEATSVAVQCLGGYGYLEEYPVAGLFRDAVSLRAAAHIDVPVPP